MLVFTNLRAIHLLRLSKMQAFLPVKKATEKIFFDLVLFAQELCKRAKHEPDQILSVCYKVLVLLDAMRCQPVHKLGNGSKNAIGAPIAGINIWADVTPSCYGTRHTSGLRRLNIGTGITQIQSA